MGLEKLGINLDSKKFVTVDDTFQTNVKGIYGAGDVIGEPMFVYTAAYEGALAAENAILGSTAKRDYTTLPWVIFTDPQVAGVGLDEKQALAKEVETDVAVLTLENVPRSLDTRFNLGPECCDCTATQKFDA